MAINVYMVFFMSFNPTTFRHYLWLYCLICYGLPAIPAFVFLFIKDPHGLIYGDAVVSKREFFEQHQRLHPFFLFSVSMSV